MMFPGVVSLGAHETLGIGRCKVFIKFGKIFSNISSNIFSHHLLLEFNYTYVRPLDVVPWVPEALLHPPTPQLSSPSALYFRSFLLLKL